jgi:hypothetical protein
MADATWHAEVARLLEEAAEALRAGRHPRPKLAHGAPGGYVTRPGDGGDKFAQELLRHTVAGQKDDPTERFTFAPGELEALAEKK